MKNQTDLEQIKHEILENGWSGPWSFFSESDLKKIYDVIFEKYDNLIEFDFNNKNLVEKLKSGKIKSTQKTVPSNLLINDVMLFAKNTTIINFFKKYFSSKEIKLSSFSDFRLNFPSTEKNNATGWHQDIETFYTVIDDDFNKNSLAMWVSLTGSTVNNGVEFLNKSHKTKKIYNTVFSNQKIKLNKIITDNEVENFKIETFSSNPGDVVFIDPFVLHRTCNKNSDFLRLSFDIRYVDVKSKIDFKFTGWRIKFFRMKKQIRNKYLNKKVLKKPIKKFIELLGYKVYAKKFPNNFEIKGLKFYASDNSVGLTPQGEITALTAVKLIKERGLKNINLLDICCGTGIVGLTIFNLLRDTEFKLSSLTLTDINIFNIESIKQTLVNNNLKNEKIDVILSDNLKSINENNKFDIIVSNPPHIFSDSFFVDNTDIDSDKIGTYDVNWEFHEYFYQNCNKFLNTLGQVWFFENGTDANIDDFLPIIKKNSNLKFKENFIDFHDKNFFWMISEKN